MLSYLHDHLEELQIWCAIFLNDYGRYLWFAGLMFLVIGFWKSKAWSHRKIRPNRPKNSQIWREIRYSTYASAIFATFGFLMVIGEQYGFVKIYTDISTFGWVYFGVSLTVMIIVHDAYFYWTHRLLHHPALFRYAHVTHHRSHSPTPWTAYAFDPIEAAINGAFVFLFVCVMPAHPAAIFLFMTHMIARNVLGHCGYELMPKGMLRHPVFKWLTSVTHHDLHHASSRYNFGLYFSYWDKWMGTEHPEYQVRFEKITQQPLTAKQAVNDPHAETAIKRSAQ